MTEMPKIIFVRKRKNVLNAKETDYNFDCASYRYIIFDEHDRRVTELLEANNKLLERARIAEEQKIAPSDALSACTGITESAERGK